jgi:hypothetical protein
MKRDSPQEPKKSHRHRFLRTYPFAKYGTTCLAGLVSLIRLYEIFRGSGGSGHL